MNAPAGLLSPSPRHPPRHAWPWRHHGLAVHGALIDASAVALTRSQAELARAQVEAIHHHGVHVGELERAHDCDGGRGGGHARRGASGVGWREHAARADGWRASARARAREPACAPSLSCAASSPVLSHGAAPKGFGGRLSPELGAGASLSPSAVAVPFDLGAEWLAAPDLGLAWWLLALPCQGARGEERAE